ncbi:MAG TPA: hypothetical protein VG710_00015, partial [Opitutus sp.]|nr:hypothetical protein [Opitutus sp.]
QIREVLITARGVRLVPAYLGPAGVLTGSARLTQEAKDRADARRAEDEYEHKRLALDHRRKAVEAQITALQAQLQSEEEEFHRTRTANDDRRREVASEKEAIAASRRRGSA